MFFLFKASQKKIAQINGFDYLTGHWMTVLELGRPN
jgi:hypothetical protein